MFTRYQNYFSQNDSLLSKRFVYDQDKPSAAPAPAPESEAKKAHDAAVTEAVAYADDAQAKQRMEDLAKSKLDPKLDADKRAAAEKELKGNSTEFSNIDSFISKRAEISKVIADLPDTADVSKIDKFLKLISQRADLNGINVFGNFTAKKTEFLGKIDAKLKTVSKAYIDLYKGKIDGKVEWKDATLDQLKTASAGLNALLSLKLQGFPGVTEAKDKEALASAVEDKIKEIKTNVSSRIAELKKDEKADQKALDELSSTVTGLSKANDNYNAAMASKDPDNKGWQAGAEQFLAMRIVQDEARKAKNSIPSSWAPTEADLQNDGWKNYQQDGRNYLNALAAFNRAEELSANKQAGDSRLATESYKEAKRLFEKVKQAADTYESNNVEQKKLAETAQGQAKVARETASKLPCSKDFDTAAWLSTYHSHWKAAEFAFSQGSFKNAKEQYDLAKADYEKLSTWYAKELQDATGHFRNAIGDARRKGFDSINQTAEVNKTITAWMDGWIKSPGKGDILSGTVLYGKYAYQNDQRAEFATDIKVFFANGSARVELMGAAIPKDAPIAYGNANPQNIG